MKRVVCLVGVLGLFACGGEFDETVEIEKVDSVDQSGLEGVSYPVPGWIVPLIVDYDSQTHIGTAILVDGGKRVLLNGFHADVKILEDGGVDLRGWDHWDYWEIPNGTITVGGNSVPGSFLFIRIDGNFYRVAEKSSCAAMPGTFHVFSICPVEQPSSGNHPTYPHDFSEGIPRVPYNTSEGVRSYRFAPPLHAASFSTLCNEGTKSTNSSLWELTDDIDTLSPRIGEVEGITNVGTSNNLCAPLGQDSACYDFRPDNYHLCMWGDDGAFHFTPSWQIVGSAFGHKGAAWYNDDVRAWVCGQLGCD